MHGGTHDVCSVDEKGGDIYELGLPEEAVVPDVVLAHESAHLLLGASDEYANAKVPARRIYNDNSLMGPGHNSALNTAEIKVRHFLHLANEVAALFPGHSVSIER
jgi:hypothetical protein